MELDMRKMRILQAIIDDYILTATPVGSRTVSKKSDIALSSATIRNVMSDLEEMGYLEQPHTSAGRIPSEKAYRLYVNSIMHRAMLTESEQRFIQNCYSNTINKVDEIVRQTAWVLSNMTKYTSLVLSPNINAVKLKHIQLVPVTEGKALVVIVTDAGITRDYMIRVPRDITAEQLERISRILTERLRNKRLDTVNQEEIPELYVTMKEQRDFLNDTLDTVRKSAENGSKLELSGANNMLNYPEYSDMDKARSFLNVIESKDMLRSMLTEATKVEFSVTIGTENPSEDMKDCSLVTATYKVGGTPLGSLGVIGPTRMDYARVLACWASLARASAPYLQICLKRSSGKLDKKHENRKKDDKDPVEPKPEKNEAEEELVPEETVTLKQDEFQQVRDHITKLEGERDEMKNLAQRVQADFDNFRRRNASVYADSLAEGERNVIKELLPVIDNFERALNNSENVDQNYVEGVRLVYKQLMDVLTKKGLEEIDASGKFDPELHNAVMQGESDDAESGDILEVFQKGYKVKDRIIRHSMVKVAK